MASLRNLNVDSTLVLQPLLGPVVALNLWTFTMEAWMYATRLPAMSKYKVDAHPKITAAEFDKQLPAEVQWKAHNYNHLFEQPTQFYAVALTLALLGVRDKTSTRLAWAYVGIRVIHSLIQATTNIIPYRFMAFAASSFTLLGLTARAASEVFSH